LSELGDELLRLVTSPPGVPVLLTGRNSAKLEIDALKLPNPAFYRMVCFGPKQVRDYVARFFRPRPELATKVQSALRQSPGPRHLAQIPLLLGLLCKQVERYPNAAMPRTRTELLGFGLRSLFERGDAKARPRREPDEQRHADKEAVLRWVAWRFHGRTPLPINRLELLNLIEGHLPAFRHDPPRNARALFDEFLLQDGILVPIDPDHVRFVLRSFHEYCLAGWIAHESGPARDGSAAGFRQMIAGDALAWGRWNDPGREGESPGDDDTICFLAWERGADPGWEGVYPLKEPEWRHIWPLVCGQLSRRSDWLLEPLLPYDTLNEMSRASSRRARRSGSCLLPYDTLNEMSRVAEVVAEAPSSSLARRKFTKRLTATLRRSEDDRDVCESCVDALARIGGDDSRNALVSILQNRDENPGFQGWCASALGGFGDDVSRNALISILQNPAAHGDARSSCADALAWIADDASRNALISVLQDDEIEFAGCARALGWFFLFTGSP
jgi:hypothetical protein